MMPESTTAGGEALAGALEYVEAGYLVGPVTISLGADGKKDVRFHTNWVNDPHGITGEVDQVLAWAKAHPGCSWHAPCGPNGMVVAEGDVKGAESGVWNWHRAGGPSSPMKVTTRSGGEHWYFRAPEEPIRNSAGQVPGVPGVDVRGDGGTVFIAGSVVHGGGGHYSTTRVVPPSKLPELPESWARKLREAGGRTHQAMVLPEGPQTHEIGWVARKAEQWLTDIASGEEGGFRERLFAAAFFGFHAVAAGLLSNDEVLERCYEAIRITWHHDPNDEDREWLRDAWRKSQNNPWTIVEDGQLPVPDDVGNQSERVETEPALTSTGTDGTSSGNSSEQEDERSTWWPRDLDRYLHDDEAEIEEEPGPASLFRDDGQALIYAGKINGLIGESESGKSWVAMHAAAQVIAEGGHVLYVDFEDSDRGVVSRLRALGAEKVALRRQLVYVGPQESLASVLARRDFTEVRSAREWALIVVDGFNVAMTLLGLDLNSNDDATKFYTRLLRPLAATQAAVLYVDHVPKNAEGRGKGAIGAQQKRALTDGAALRVEVNEPFGRGQVGRLRLTVDKDRPGHVRGAALEANWVGTAVLSSDVDTGDVHAVIEAPAASGDGRREPTTVMVKVSEFLMTGREQEWSNAAVASSVGGRKAVVLDALDALARRGYIVRTEGARKSVMNRFVKRFTTLEPSDPAYFLGTADEDGLSDED